MNPSPVAPALAACLLLASSAAAGAGVSVLVTVTGEVEYNQIGAPPLGNAQPGDPATLTFLVDSGVFQDGASFPTRGYAIDPDSFVLTLGATTIGLQDPFPAGQTPWFVLRNDDPAVDGFFVASSLDFPTGVPLDQVGVFEPFRNAFSVTYDGTTLGSLELLDALGTYDFTGLSVFNWTVDDGPFQPLGIVFEQLTVAPLGAAVPAAGAGPLALLGLGVAAAGGLALRLRRRAA